MGESARGRIHDRTELTLLNHLCHNVCNGIVIEHRSSCLLCSTLLRYHIVSNHHTHTGIDQTVRHGARISIDLHTNTPMAVMADNIQCQPLETVNNRGVNNFSMRCRTTNCYGTRVWTDFGLGLGLGPYIIISLQRTKG